MRLPPKFVFMPAEAVYNPALPDNLFRTMAALVGLCWQSKGAHTPPMFVADLMALRGLSKTQVFEHLKKLKEIGAISIEQVGMGQIVVTPLRWSDNTPSAFGETSDDEDLIAALCADSPSPENRTESQSGKPDNSPENRTIINNNLLNNNNLKNKNNNSPENRTENQSGKPDGEEVGAAVLAAISGQMTRQAFMQYFSGAQVRVNGGGAVIAVNAGMVPFVGSRLGPVISRACGQVLGREAFKVVPL